MFRTRVAPFSGLLAAAFVALTTGCTTGPFPTTVDDRAVAPTPAPIQTPEAVEDAGPAFGTPQEALEAFLEFYFDGYGSGLPDVDERRALGALLTPDFLQALDAAASADRCARAASQGREPPLVQGDVFSSLFEKATSVVSVEELGSADDAATYALHFEHRPGESARPDARWNDEVKLRRVAGGWRIDDFERGGDWQFMTQGSVKAMLRGIAGLCPSR